MGVLTDFVVADSKDAQHVCDSNCPSAEFDGLEARGIDVVKLGTLYGAVTNKVTDDPASLIGDPICTGGDEGPWVFEVPPTLVEHLAKLDASEIQLLAAQWAATEEFSPQYDNWPKEAVHQMLEELASLCRRASDQGKGVLMWMSL